MKRSPSSDQLLPPPKQTKGRNYNLASLDRAVSPPPTRSTIRGTSDAHASTRSNDNKARADANDEHESQYPNLAAIEAGQVQVTNHLSVISSRLEGFIRPNTPGSPQIQISDWLSLYERNLHAHGRHFVIHQHDHPIAGPHYDLRLQFSDSSSVSWSIMYGLPGDPNSRRLNRNATETRVHCLWNHLIETASARTGSLIIWDTGEYEILPYENSVSLPETDDSRSDVSSDTPATSVDSRTESDKLRQSFQNRKVRLRLHGTRLPPNYTIILRLDRASRFLKPNHTSRKRRRRAVPSKVPEQPITSSSSSDTSSSPPSTHSTSTSTPGSSARPKTSRQEPDAEHSDADENIDQQIRINNAYPGSTNSIGSIHQRRWFVSLDRVNSGFVDVPGNGPAGKRWVRKSNSKTGELSGFVPFYVRGPDMERSVVTGRLGRDVLEDESVEGFVPRRGWMPVLE